MGANSKSRAKEKAESIQTALPELYFSLALLQQFLVGFAEYRTELPVKEVMVFPDGFSYYVCPRCSITLDRDFMAYCDRCGQHLGWEDYKKARRIFPGRNNSLT